MAKKGRAKSPNKNEYFLEFATQTIVYTLYTLLLPLRMIFQVLQIWEARILGSFEPAIEKGPAMAHLNPQ